MKLRIIYIIVLSFFSFSLISLEGMKKYKVSLGNSFVNFEVFKKLTEEYLQKKFSASVDNDNKNQNGRTINITAKSSDKENIRNMVLGLSYLFIDDPKEDQIYLKRISECAGDKSPDCQFINELFKGIEQNPNVATLLQMYVNDCYVKDDAKDKYRDLCNKKVTELSGFEDFFQEIKKASDTGKKQLDYFISSFKGPLEEKAPFQSEVQIEEASSTETGESKTTTEIGTAENEVRSPEVNRGSDSEQGEAEFNELVQGLSERATAPLPEVPAPAQASKSSTPEIKTDKDLVEFLNKLKGKKEDNKVLSFIKNISDQVKAFIERQNIKNKVRSDDGRGYQIPTSQYRSQPYVKDSKGVGNVPDAKGYFEGEPTIVKRGFSLYKAEQLLKNPEIRDQIKEQCKRDLGQACSKINMLNFIQAKLSE